MDCQKIEKELYQEWRQLQIRADLINRVIGELAMLRGHKREVKRKWPKVAREKIAAAQRARWAMTLSHAPASVLNSATDPTTKFVGVRPPSARVL